MITLPQTSNEKGRSIEDESWNLISHPSPPLCPTDITFPLTLIIPSLSPCTPLSEILYLKRSFDSPSSVYNRKDKTQRHLDRRLIPHVSWAAFARPQLLSLSRVSSPLGLTWCPQEKRQQVHSANKIHTSVLRSIGGCNREMEQDHPLLVEPFAFAPPLGLHPSSAMKGSGWKSGCRAQAEEQKVLFGVFLLTVRIEGRRSQAGGSRSGACLVDSGLVWDESGQTFCPLRREHTPVFHLIPPQEWVA